MNPFVNLRRTLHAHPEVSGNERQTHDRIAAFLRAHAPAATLITHIAQTGLVAIINPDAERTVIFRCDTDALPIEERTGAPHASTHPGCMHACGHDGHSAIAAALTASLASDPIPETRVIVVFQPAEETGQGAAAILADPKWDALNIDPARSLALAIHNLPGFPMAQILSRPGPMCPASLGLRLELTGTTGHASQPDACNSPIAALSRIALELPELPTKHAIDHALITPTALHTGIDLNFGVTPAHASACFTLRAPSNDQLNTLLAHTRARITDHASSNNLTDSITLNEQFPAVVNDPALTQRVRSILTLDHATLETPMPWSEDFGHFSSRYPSLLLGIGSGPNQPHLHANTFDFPDELLEITPQHLRTIIEHLTHDCIDDPI